MYMYMYRFFMLLVLVLWRRRYFGRPLSLAVIAIGQCAPTTRHCRGHFHVLVLRQLQVLERRYYGPVVFAVIAFIH